MVELLFFALCCIRPEAPFRHHSRNAKLRSVGRPRAIIAEMGSSHESRHRGNLLGRSVEDLRDLALALGEGAYRGAQIYHALYAEQRTDFGRMTSLPVGFRERLARETTISLPQIRRAYRSEDGTVRYVLALPGSDESRLRSRQHATAGATIETVFMSEENRQTICVSTQAGCAVDCHFCLTATLGLIRNLTAGEILGQVLIALRENRDALKPQTNVVLMGQGEPLLNYEAVMAAMRILLDPNGMAISPKHVTLSTSGIIPGIERLAKEKIRPKLAISLNASSNPQRDQIMPINRKYPIEKLLAACRAYPLRPWEKLTFEYVLLGGFNDSPEDARRVVKLVSNLRAKVNLIPWNPGDLPYEKPDPERTEAFRKVLSDKGVPVFVRYSRGQDVMGACGQLALLEAGTPNLAQISPAATQ
jgi:23S rRNA (adenine2503-C2)-methyltransferase